MITPMKKLSIVIMDKEKKDSLTQLKKLGLLHLKEKIGISSELVNLNDEIKELETALKYTDESMADHKSTIDVESIKVVIQNIIKAGKELDILEEEESLLSRNIEFLEPWGNFNPKDIDDLNNAGIKFSLLEVSKDELEILKKTCNCFVIKHNNSGYLIAAVGEINGEFSIFEPPKLGLDSTLDRLRYLQTEVVQKKKELEDLSKYHGKILSYREYLDDKCEFEGILSGMTIDSDFSVLEGWIPEVEIEKFKILAKKKSWAYYLLNPEEGDDTPTLLKGNKITSMIHPLLDFLGNVPGYWEKDVSGLFLVFFTMFFAMIIGDAGYGIVFVVGTVLLNIKLKKLSNIVSLLYVISIATVVWGAITGNWFGSALLKGTPILNSLILSQLSTDRQIMELCFHIAVIHLSIARLIAFVKDIKDKNIGGVANLGWATMLVGLLFIVKNLVISSTDYPIPSFALILIAIGFSIVIIFGKQEKGKNFFKGIGISLAFSPLTALDTVGAFGDIISYVRLYAVGLAGFAVAQSFNGMAEPLIQSGGFGYIGALLILLGGHVFNIAMAALSVLVHGVRLNVLEFSSHADVNWTGRKFNPFREKDII